MLDWYLNRLKTMSLKEVVFMRLYRFLRSGIVGERINIPDSLTLKINPFNGKYLNNYERYFTYGKKVIVNIAEEIIGGDIEIFGIKHNFQDEIDWNTDFIDGSKYPTMPSRRIIYRKTFINDPKIILELNRHQFLPTLGMAFYLSGDKKFAERALLLINSWIDQNRPYHGINWSSGIELALRQLSWLWTIKYIESFECINEERNKKIRESMFLQTEYISKHLSLYSSANNHLISELAAMLVVGIHLGQDEWVKKALKLLVDQIDNQILPDGVGAEQSPSYQVNTMEYYIISVLALEEKGYDITEKLLKGLNRGAIFIQAILESTGLLPNIGDNDSGEVLKLSYRYSNNKSILNLTSYITGEKALLQDDVIKDEKTFWLLGPEKYSKLLENHGKKNNVNKMAFNEGGYYLLEKTLNKRKVKLIFDCGPLGMEPMAGHGHADALSFILYVDDLPVMIDPGTYTYYKSDKWRGYFRGTSAHNAIRIDGEDQSVFAGKFIALKHAHSEITEWVEGESVSGRHYGYKRLANPVVHNRTILVNDQKTGLDIIDHIEADGEHLIEQFFHLDNRFDLRNIGGNLYEISNPEKSITVQLDRCMETAIYYGDDAIPLGWYSHSFENMEKTFSLVGRTRIRSSEKFITEIRF